MRHLDENERKKLSKLLERKGRRAAMLDEGARPILSTAERRDVNRKGFLQGLADMCAVAMDPRGMAMPKEDIVECLQGALEGLERV